MKIFPFPAPIITLLTHTAMCLLVVSQLTACGGGGGGGGGSASPPQPTVAPQPTEPTVTNDVITLPQGMSVGAILNVSERYSGTISGCPTTVVCLYEAPIIYIHSTVGSVPGTYLMSIHVDKTECAVLFGCVTTVLVDKEFELRLVTYSPPINFTKTSHDTINIPSIARYGDVNRDGIADIVTANSQEDGARGSVSIFSGVGDGSFNSVQLLAGTGPVQDVAIADMNQDSFPDLVVALLGGDSGIGLITEISDESELLELSGFFAMQSPIKLLLGDVTADGQADVIAWSRPSPDDIIHKCINLCSDGSIVILENMGFNEFRGLDRINLDLGLVRDFDVGDVNNDGLLDIVVARESSLSYFSGHTTLDVYVGNGHGHFSKTNSYQVIEKISHKVHLVDINGDLNLDALLPGRLVFISLGSGSSFNPATENLARRSSITIDSGDLNGDQIQDIIVADLGSITVMLNDEHRLWPNFSLLAATPNHVLSEDVNGDGLSDIIITSKLHRSVSVWLTQL